MQTLSIDALAQALALRDLSDPAQGPHAMQQLVAAVEAAVAVHWQCPVQCLRGSALVPVRDNHDALGHPPDAADTRYCHYINDEWMLRTRTWSVVPAWLRSWRDRAPRRLALVSPGLVHRRERIDRWHTDAPHQIDAWMLVPRGDPEDDGGMVDRAVARVMEAALPDHAVDMAPSGRPWAEDGEHLDAILENGRRIGIGACGRIHPELLARSGWDPERTTGIAMRLGLDRLLMLRKGLPDIRLLRSEDPRVLAQMQDLGAWERVSDQPPILRDLSFATAAGLDAATLGDRIRAALGDEAEWLETVRIVSETPYESLPQSAIEGPGIRPGMKNVRLRLTIRHPSRRIPPDEADALRNRVHRALHQGSPAMTAE